MRITLRLFLCLYVALSASAQVIPIATAVNPDVHTQPLALTPPLLVSVQSLYTNAPVADLPVQFTSASPNLLVLGTTAATNASGFAAIECVGLAAGSASVQATLPSGNVVVFQVTVDAPAPGQTQITSSEFERLTLQGHSTYADGQPFTAQLLAGDGSPLAGATVSAGVVVGSAQLLDYTGQAASQFTADASGALSFHLAFPAGSSDDLSAVSLILPDGTSRAFLVHALPPAEPPQFTLSGNTTPPLSLVEAAAGNPLQLKLTTAAGAPLAGVSVTFATSPASRVSCDGNFSWTDASGVFSCSPTILGPLGAGVITFTAGRLVSSTPVSYNLAPGSATYLRIISGNGQSGVSGSTLQPLLLQVVDRAGNGVPDVPVSWRTSNATITSSTAQTDAGGFATATLQLASEPGMAFTVATAGSLTAQFRLENNTLVRLVTIAGDLQTTLPAARFSQPLQVQITSADGTALAGRNVVFTVRSGAADLSSTIAATDANGTASTFVTAGLTPGLVSVQADSGTGHVQFLLSVTAPVTVPPPPTNPPPTNPPPGNPPPTNPTPPALSISLTDWNGQPASVVPGALMKVQFPIEAGQNYSAVSYNAPPYPLSAEGVEASVNGFMAPVLSLTPGTATAELLIQIPWEISGAADVSLTVQTSTGMGTLSGLATMPVLPEVFFSTDGTNVTLENDNGMILPAGTPVRAGSAVTLPLTGTGALTPAAGTNMPPFAGQIVQMPILVFIDGLGVSVTAVTPDVNTVGITNVRVQLPAQLGAGPHRIWAAAISNGTLVKGTEAQLTIQ